MTEWIHEINPMQAERATALAELTPATPEGPEDVARPVTAESFRQLTERLKARKVAPPPVPDNVIPLRKALPRAAERAPAPAPAPDVDATPITVPDTEPVQPEPPPAAVAEPPAEVIVAAPIAEAVLAEPPAEVLVTAPMVEAVPAEPPVEAADSPLPAPDAEPVIHGGDGEGEAGDTALALLELMATTGPLPQERALAADTLLMLLPRIPARQLARVAERVAIMDNPPPLLVERLIRDPRAEIMGPVLERNANLCDRDMIAAAPVTDLERLRMIARRRTLSPVMSGHLVASGDPGVILALLRNGGAELPHQCFARLCALAADHQVLLAPLATRSELPPEAAFELYWHLPPELRRLVLSRFLTDSGTLGRVLRLALAQDSAQSARTLRGEGPVEAAAIDPAAFDAAFEAAAEGTRMDEAVRSFAELAGIAEGTARRILTDQQGDPTAVLFKAMGVSRTRFVEALDSLVAMGALEPGDSQDLHAVFDGLSFTKARMLLTYWDWFTRRAGPYESWTVAQVEAAAPC